MIHGLLTVTGYPNVDDDISGTTFEFWGSWVDYLLSSEPSNKIWISNGKREIKRAIQGYWKKIRMPASDEIAKWSKDQRDGFMTFRKDVADFVDSAYGLLGPTIFEQFVEQIGSALIVDINTQKLVAWEEVEASIFCLNSLSDSLGDEPYEDVFLKKLFGGPLFALLVQVGHEIPLKARTSSVNVIGSYATFFERSPEFLPPALNFLFTCIATPVLAVSASRSISSLCSSCRATLTDELPTFLNQYGLFTAVPSTDDAAKERVLCAISYIIQALPTDDQKIGPLDTLLNHIEVDIQRCVESYHQGRVEEAREAGLMSLRCLVSIGKGLQAPDDLPIDLNGDRKTHPFSFWGEGDGNLLQKKLLNLVQTICNTLVGDGEVIDSACGVFKAGFTEVTPGLFCFSPTVVTEFLLCHAWRTETILATASTFISSHSIDGSLDIRSDVLRLLELVDELVSKLGDPQNEPEVAQSMIEFLSRLLRRYMDVLVVFRPKENIEQLFLFTLNSLSVREPLVKKAAASFWASFLSASDMDESTQTATDEIVNACGPKLAEKLAWGLGGGCQRSEIEIMTEPLRKLVFRQVKAKSWLLAALAKDGISGPNVSVTDKRLFVDKVMSLRGKRSTNQVTKEFWLKSRGTEFACMYRSASVIPRF
ncbi:armadillo-type protein [Geopyxis carbonaria]|nr:armadillo-type protein [Geopyxis carbonaria]